MLGAALTADYAGWWWANVPVATGEGSHASELSTTNVVIVAVPTIISSQVVAIMINK